MEVLQSQEKGNRSRQNLLEVQGNLLNQILDLLKATSPGTFNEPPKLSDLERQDLPDRYETPRGRSPSAGPNQDQERSRRQLGDLLRALEFDGVADTAAKDASVLLNTIGNLSSCSQDRARALITSPVMQEWLTSIVSLPLLVNGQMFSSEEEIRQSPLSYFCAKLADSILSPSRSGQMRKNDAVFVVRWFCGEHTNFYDYGPGKTDYDAHPPGMLSNMLVQLIVQLLQCPSLPQLSHLSNPSNAPQLSELCDLFMLLVEALPKGSILFIIIDGIFYYEDKERREECMEVLSMLTEMARGGPGFASECLIKLLVTSPLRSHCVQDLFEESEIMDLNE